MIFRKRLLLSVFLVCCSFHTYAEGSDALKSVIMPNACLVGEANLVKIHQAAIVKKIKSNKTLFPKINPNEFNNILGKYGLSEQDFPRAVFAFGFNAAERSKELQMPKFVFGIEMLKPVSIENLKSIITDVLRKQREKVAIKIEEKNSLKFLQIREVKSNSEIVLIPLKKEKVIIGGETASAFAAVKRVKSGEKVVLNSKLTNLRAKVSPEANLYVLGYLPNSIRKKLDLSDKTKTNSQQAGNAPNFDAFKNIDSLILQAGFSKKLIVNILSHFKDKQSAYNAQLLIQQLLPVAKFQLMMMTKGVYLPVINSLESTLSNKYPEVKVFFTVSEVDINGINKILRKST